MGGFTRWISIVAPVAAVMAIGVPSASTAVGSQLPGLYFVYGMNCTFTVENDAGTPVTSIPPGTYDTVVRTPVPFGAYPIATLAAGDLTACHGLAQFQLTGPGVSLNTTVYGGCLTDEEYTETFQPNATYVAQDNNQPAVTKTVLTTLAAGTPLPTPTGSSLGKGSSSSTDIVGSGIVQARGTLLASLSAAGRATLTMKGKAVTKLASGKYTFKVSDGDRKGDFTISAPALGITEHLTGLGFVGKETATITLKPGKWQYSSGAGKAVPFSVVAAS
jgi:hypothetical protein